ncbi:hypothetical protein MASR2M17_22150 [Aminivibrio sp.]
MGCIETTGEHSVSPYLRGDHPELIPEAGLKAGSSFPSREDTELGREGLPFDAAPSRKGSIVGTAMRIPVSDDRRPSNRVSQRQEA